MKQFRKRGLAKEQRYLAEGIALNSLSGKSILEIGCGVGGLHLTLLKQGASSSFGIDMSEGMLEGARQLSKEFGFEQQTNYRLGDFATMTTDIPKSDIVILDKVVCCYENLDLMLQTSMGKSLQCYALSFPRRNIFIRSFFHIPIFLGTILRWSFRPYWHDWQAMTHRIQQSGFQETYSNHTYIWDVKIFTKK